MKMKKTFNKILATTIIVCMIFAIIQFSAVTVLADAPMVITSTGTITLEDVNITAEQPFVIVGNITVTLNLIGHNYLTATNGAGLHVPAGATLIINGSGSLTATAGGVDSHHAGIGGIGSMSTGAAAVDRQSGTIIINDGIVVAEGVGNGAGIGGGGTISATGGVNSLITINDGHVTAYSGSGGGHGAAIGSGGATHGLAINQGVHITGGTVVADARGRDGTGGGGAGIGLGNGHIDGTISTMPGAGIHITGGENTNVTAFGGMLGGSGIGMGGTTGNSTALRIDAGIFIDADVEAHGGGHGAGIGGGGLGEGTVVVIESGARVIADARGPGVPCVNAIGTYVYGGAGIGGGGSSTNNNLYAGHGGTFRGITVHPGAYVRAYGSGNGAGIGGGGGGLNAGNGGNATGNAPNSGIIGINLFGQVTAVGAGNGVGIGGGGANGPGVSGTGGDITIGGANLYARGGTGGVGIGGGTNGVGVTNTSTSIIVANSATEVIAGGAGRAAIGLATERMLYMSSIDNLNIAGRQDDFVPVVLYTDNDEAEISIFADFSSFSDAFSDITRLYFGQTAPVNLSGIGGLTGNPANAAVGFFTAYVNLPNVEFEGEYIPQEWEPDGDVWFIASSFDEFNERRFFYAESSSMNLDYEPNNVIERIFTERMMNPGVNVLYIGEGSIVPSDFAIGNEFIIIGQSSTNNVTLPSDFQGTIMLEDVNISGVSPISFANGIANNANVTFLLSGRNVLTATSGAALHVPSGATVTLRDNPATTLPGTLEATALGVRSARTLSTHWWNDPGVGPGIPESRFAYTHVAAAIGGIGGTGGTTLPNGTVATDGVRPPFGNIIIESGNIIAETHGHFAAAIGAGNNHPDNANQGSVVITGGNVSVSSPNFFGVGIGAHGIDIAELVILPAVNLTTNIGGPGFFEGEDRTAVIGTAANMLYMNANRQSIGPIVEGRYPWPLRIDDNGDIAELYLYFRNKNIFDINDINFGRGAGIDTFTVGGYSVVLNDTGVNAYSGPTGPFLPNIEIIQPNNLNQSSDFIEAVEFSAVHSHNNAISASPNTKWYVNGVRQQTQGATFSFTPPTWGIFEVHAVQVGTPSDPVTVRVDRAFVMPDAYNTGHITPREQLRPLGDPNYFPGVVTNLAGVYRITEDTLAQNNGVLEGFYSVGRTVQIVAGASGITLRDFYIDGEFGINRPGVVIHGIHNLNAHNVIIEDGTIVRTSDAIVAGMGDTIRRIHIKYHRDDGIKMEHDALIYDNYIHTLGFISPRSHPDGVQTAGRTGGSRNIIVRNNRIDTIPQPPYGAGATVIIGSDLNSVRNVIVEDNILNNVVLMGESGGGPFRNGTIRDNLIGHGAARTFIDGRTVWSDIVVADNIFIETVHVGSVIATNEAGQRISPIRSIRGQSDTLAADAGDEVTITVNTANYSLFERGGRLTAALYRNGERVDVLGENSFRLSRYIPWDTRTLGGQTFAGYADDLWTINNATFNAWLANNPGGTSDEFFLQWYRYCLYGTRWYLVGMGDAFNEPWRAPYGRQFMAPATALPNQPANVPQTVTFTLPDAHTMYGAELRVIVTHEDTDMVLRQVRFDLDGEAPICDCDENCDWTCTCLQCPWTCGCDEACDDTCECPDCSYEPSLTLTWNVISPSPYNTFTVAAYFNIPASGILIIAVYDDDGRMVRTVVGTPFTNQLREPISVLLTDSERGSDWNIRAFAWNAVGGMIPLGESFESDF